MCRVSVSLRLWCVLALAALTALPADCLNGDHVCMVQQKYNITKRVKYRAPMSVRTYEWCFSMPPRCSRWKTEIRELTKLETDERIAEVAVCCPGYKMRDVSCVPICPNGRTGHGCSEDCPDNKWGPNCINVCDPCKGGICSPITGQCSCQDGWQGESCEIRMPTSTTTAEDLLTKIATKPTPPKSSTVSSTTASVVTTLGSTPTTLIEFTTHSEKSESNRSVSVPDVIVRPPSLSTETSLIPDLTSQKPVFIKIQSPTERNTISTSFVTIFEAERTLPTKKPLAADKSIRIPVTTPMNIFVKDVTSKPKEPVETIVKSTTKEPSTGKTTSTSLNNDYLLPTSTTAAVQEVNKTTKSYQIPTSITALPSSTDSNIFTKVSTAFPKLQVQETTTSIIPQNNITKSLNVPKSMHELKVPVKVAHDKIEISRTTLPRIIKNATETSQTTKFILTTERTTRVETTKRPQSTIRFFPTTIKFKPKEIWIRPAQKGEQHKLRTEINHESHSKPKPTPANTTPKTIIVSIIPTSVSYATFKKISLSTTSLSQNNNKTGPTNITSEREVTKPMTTSTTEATRSTLVNPKVTQKIIPYKVNKTNVSASNLNLDRTTTAISYTTRELPMKTVPTNETNSMTTIRNLNSSNSLTTSSTNAAPTRNISQESTTKHPKTEKVTRPIKIVTMKPRNVTIITVSGKNKNETLKITKTITKDVEKTNATYTNQVTTERDEEFHILTEPEHITAVMEGKGTERSSVDLISVISIAGGVMMAVITVAVVIVMMERWKRPRYEHGRKISDIRMQVIIDDDDVPPPYVRSIFHTPLPDPPSSEKCHYQPISTLDRNLKQFMRPVVVQSISPIMLENFRGILECHYDHLPRRCHTLDPRHCSVAPSLEDSCELTRLRPCSNMESTIEAMKCEARLDVIDNTTSEPLYAEIPCWRPPSEHAVEIINLNGEAVTEL